MFFDYNKVLSYNAMFNFLVGERGVGKTYGAKKFVINQFKKNYKDQFVYIRRYKTEIKKSCGNKNNNKFFEQIMPEFKNDIFGVSGDSELKLFTINGKVAGYGIPLSVANILKSTSFDNVKTIIFDEFIINQGCYHYLKDEVIVLLDIVETIARLRDIRVIFLGNAISTDNPYFIFFKLSLPYKNDIKTFKDGLILINYIKNEEYRAFKKQTKFGKLIEGTEYSKYAIDNEFLKDSKTFIQKKTKNCKFYFKIYFAGSKYGVWIDTTTQLMFISDDYDNNCPIEFSFATSDHNETTILIRSKNSVHFKALMNYYKIGNLRFENQRLKNLFYDFIAKHAIY